VADADPGVGRAGGDVGLDHAVGVEAGVEYAAGGVAEQHGVAGADGGGDDDLVVRLDGYTAGDVVEASGIVDVVAVGTEARARFASGRGHDRIVPHRIGTRR